jgi:hypothetical protein
MTSRKMSLEEQHGRTLQLTITGHCKYSNRESLLVEMVQFDVRRHGVVISNPLSNPVPNKREPNSNPIAEVGRFITHPPQFFVCVLQSTGLSSGFHDPFPSCVDSFVRDCDDGQHDKPHTYEPQLNSIC